MMKKLTLVLVGLVFLCSCSHDNAEETKSMQPQPESYEISEAQALEDLQSMLDETESTRNFDPGSAEVLVLRKGDFARTRSIGGTETDNTPLAYVVNFANGGYAILGADLRQSSVIALVEQGQMMPETLVAAKEALDTEAQIDGRTYIHGLVANYIQTAPLDPQNQTPFIIPPGSGWVVTEFQAPLLKTQWGQNGIYSKYCINDAGQKCAAGCVAVALAQIMTYNCQTFGKAPAAIEGYAIDWPDAVSSTRHANLEDALPAEQDAVAWLIRYIGLGVKMEYGVGESNSSIESVLSFLKTRYVSSVYKNPVVDDIPKDEILRAQFVDMFVKGMILNRKQPIFIKGETSDREYGHAWVLDGWKRREKNTSFPGMPLVEEYVYCNFGWYGGEDGLYAFGAFPKNYNYYNAILTYNL